MSPRSVGEACGRGRRGCLRLEKVKRVNKTSLKMKSYREKVRWTEIEGYKMCVKKCRVRLLA